MPRIYCIGGVGTDERIFQNLAITGYELVPVHWVPFEIADNMQSYALKLSKQILDENPILLGLSFGGMLAIEIGKIKKVRKIFLVSSTKTSSSLPLLRKTSLAIKLINLVPTRLFEKPSSIGSFLVGARSKNDKDLIIAMMKDAPKGFIRRALQMVVQWNNKVFPENVVQIHGTSDRVIFPWYVHPDHWIKGGTHIMIYNRAEDVSKIIAECLSFT